MHKTRLLGLLIGGLMMTGAAHADEAQLKRGAHVALEVCNGCNSLK